MNALTTEASDHIEVPVPGHSSWPDICVFALSYNGYTRHGSEGAATIGNETRRHWHETRLLPEDLALIRCALFFEQRRWHHLGQNPDGQDRDYVDALVGALYRVTGGWLPGPADELP